MGDAADSDHHPRRDCQQRADGPDDIVIKPSVSVLADINGALSAHVRILVASNRLTNLFLPIFS